MPKRAGVIIVSVGAVLILSALLLLLYNRREDAEAGQEAGQVLAEVEAVIAARATAAPVLPEAAEATAAPSPTALAADMPVVMLEGYGYVGYLDIPVLALRLPVMADWDYGRLKLAPCRQFGLSRTDDLVIAAHNYRNHFGRLRELREGDEVSFTDMDGVVSRYAVARVDTLSPAEVEAVRDSGYDLVLYTCTTGGKTRVTVFCDRAAAMAASPAPSRMEN